MKKIAILVKDNLESFRGHAALYQLDPPMEVEGWDEDDPKEFHKYVVASAVNDGFICECYLFAANEDGGIVGWMELPGSQKMTFDHETVLNNAGYELA